MEIDTSESSNTCKCSTNYKKLKDEIFNKELFRCVSSCPFKYSKDNICVESCENKIYQNYTCVDDCVINSEQLFVYNEKYCLEKCPDSVPFYYSDAKICKSKCDNYDYYILDTKECSNSCTGYLSFIDYKTNTFICDITHPINAPDGYVCRDDFPYRYESSCLRNCSDTKNFTPSKTTYSFIIESNDDVQKKFCVEENCLKDGIQLFFDISTSSCIKDCKETSNKFYSGHKCYKNCSSVGPNYQYYKYDTFECVTECPSGWYKSIPDKACYPNFHYCYNNSKINLIYIDPKNKECLLSCDKYIYQTEKDGINAYYCLDSCSENNLISDIPESTTRKLYRKSDDKICLESCTGNSDIALYYKYTKNDNTDYICYKSCQDISGSYIYEYGNTCYANKGSIPEKSFYYTKENDIRKYKKTHEDGEEYKFCSKIGYYYLKDGDDNNKMCVKDCDNSNEYRVFYKLDNEGTITSFGEFKTTCDINSNNPYYSVDDTGSERVCRNECLKKKFVDSENHIKISDKGTCVNECPNGYYERIDGKICSQQACEFYITNNGKKKCVKDCKSISKYYFAKTPSNDQECINACKIDSTYYYYDPENNQCTTSCKDLGKFALKATNSHHQPCLGECPKRSEYYFETDNICLSECKIGNTKAYVTSPSSKICKDNCNNGEYVINGNICTDKCLKDAPYFETITSGGITIYECKLKCDNFYVKSRTISENGNSYNIYECKSQCPLFKYGDQCLEECPDEMFISTISINPDLKECKLKCPQFYEIEIIEGKKYILVNLNVELQNHIQV